MKYEKIIKGNFLSRPNRFVAQVDMGGKEVSVHVKNTGRCRELLLPGTVVYLEDFSYRPGKRKLMYDLVAVEKGELLINMDSQAPNKAAKEALEKGIVVIPEISELSVIKPEKTYGDSRFDFYIKDINGKEGFLEVKGVTLEQDGVVSFPDAPTERGIKHINELINVKEKGLCACLLFVIQMSGVRRFTPNDERHKAFGDALRLAAEKGVNILAYECDITCDTMNITKPVPVDLRK
jgi:sugar fermentation stimulation protein A